ncbi:MAG: hypothetical protein ACAH27_03065 [Xanthobacteraceae bacterium]
MTAPNPRSPILSEDGRRAVSLAAFLSALLFGLFGVWLTALLARTKTYNDLAELLDGLARDHPALFGLSAPVRWLAGALNSIPMQDQLATILVLWVQSTLFALLLWAVRRSVRRPGLPVQAGPGEIVLPREPGGGARLSGMMIAAWIGITAALLAGMPRLFDLMFPSYRWPFWSKGFVSAGLVAAALFIVLDSIAGRRGPIGALADPEPEPVAAPPELDRLREDLAAALGPALVELSVDPATSRPAGGRPAALSGAGEAHLAKLADALSPAERAAWTEAVATFGRARHHVALFEPLGAVHFAFLVEAMSLAQDAGRGVLVVVPEASARRIVGELKAAFSVHCRDITQAFWVDIGEEGGVAKSPSTLETVLVVTDETLGERLLADEAHDFAKVVERIGLIVLFDAHLFALAQLRLDLALLLQRMPAAEVRVIAHAARRRGMADALADMFTATRRGIEEMALSAGGTGAVSALAFNADVAVRDALLGAFYPLFQANRDAVEPLPLVARVGLRGSYRLREADLRLVDQGAESSFGRWYKAVTGLLGADPGSEPVLEALRRLFARRSPRLGPDDPAPVVLMQDGANLVDALSHLPAAGSGTPRLAMIACERYALRDFMRDALAGQPFHVRDEPELMPIAPRPHDGLRELARLVLSAMSVAERPAGDGPRRGIARSDAVALFEGLRESRLLAVHGLSPTRLGLARLLQGQFGDSFQVRVDPPGAAGTPPPRLGRRGLIDDDAIYVCDNAGESGRSVSGLLPLRRADIGGSERLGWVARDDHGLAYVAGTVLNARAVVRIHQVTGTAVKVDLAAGYDTGPAPRTLFCRRYRLDLDAPTAILAPPEAGPVSRRGIEVAYARLFAPLHRVTYAVINETALAQAGEDLARPPSPLPAPHQVRRTLTTGLAQLIRFECPRSHERDTDAAHGRLAFTLQVTLSDLLFSLFPGLAHRTAVISPQAAPVFRLLGASASDPVLRHLAGRYPRFEGLEPADTAAMSEALGRLLLAAGSGPAPERDAIELYVVEDWPSDLGVCGALDIHRDHVRKLWLRYLDWLAQRADRADQFHSFGAERPPEHFAFAEAAALLRAVVR